MHKIRNIAAIAAGVLSAVALGSSGATADVGDGNLGCNYGEICFARDDANYDYQKHFWYAANHSGYYFTNVNTGVADSTSLANNADQVRNRDTQCDVKVVDDRGIYPDDVFTAINDGNWKTISGDVDNENDRHERYNC